MKVDHTRDLVRLSMLDSAAGESNDAADDSSSCFGSLSGGAAVPEEDGDEAAPRTPSGPAEPLSDRVAGLGPGEAFLFGEAKGGVLERARCIVCGTHMSVCCVVVRGAFFSCLAVFCGGTAA